MTTQYKYQGDKINFSKTAIQPSSNLMNTGKNVFGVTLTNIVNQYERVNTKFIYLEIMKFIRYNELKDIKDFVDKYTVNVSYSSHDAHKIFTFDQDIIKIKPIISIMMEVRKKYQRKQYNMIKFIDRYKDSF